MAARVPRDGCVVPAGPIRELVASFVAEWYRERPSPSSTQFGFDAAAGAVQPYPPLRWLSREASRYSYYRDGRGEVVPFEIKESTLVNLLTVSGGGDARRAVVELRVADAIVLALDRPDVLFGPGPGQIPMEPNPHAREAAQRGCCGRVAARRPRARAGYCGGSTAR